jgi:hypothetical protein
MNNEVEVFSGSRIRSISEVEKVGKRATSGITTIRQIKRHIEWGWPCDDGSVENGN